MYVTPAAMDFRIALSREVPGSIAMLTFDTAGFTRLVVTQSTPAIITSAGQLPEQSHTRTFLIAKLFATPYVPPPATLATDVPCPRQSAPFCPSPTKSAPNEARPPNST